jgi:hypothetical protein
VLTVALASASGWLKTIEVVMRARLARVSDQRAVTVLVELDGAVSGRLSGEAALAWWPRADILTAAGVAGRSEPRGAAWRTALVAGSRVHAARAWREEVAQVRSPLTEVLDAAFDGAEAGASESRAALASFALDDAVALFNEICDGNTGEDAHARATMMTAALADLDAAADGVT